MIQQRRRIVLLRALVAAALVAGACAPAGANPASRQPQSTQAAQAVPTAAPAAVQPPKPFIPVGAFTAKPMGGPPGTAVTVTATGLSPSTTYDLIWVDVEGSWKLSENKWQYKGREFREVPMKLAAPTTDAAGSFTAPFVVPSGFGFQHDVRIMKGEETVNKLGFDVDMQVTISPSSGPVGTPITIEAKGIGWRDMQNSWLVSYDNKFTGWLSAVTTKGRAKAVIPAAGTAGIHMITVLHGHMSWPYLNMQQSPQPDRPQFRVPFTITDGPPVLPGPAAAQGIADAVSLPERGTFWSEPAQGVVGSSATLRATGLKPDSDVELAWVNVAGQDWVAGSRPDRVRTLGTARTDAKGEVSLRYTIPDEQGGLHPIELRSGGRTISKTAFLIAPSIQPLAVDRGPSGTEFKIQLNGMYATDTGKIVNLTYDNANVGYACSFNSGGNIQITFRATGEPGWHFIDLYPGILTGEETTPMNYRVPQLTAPADHPGERMPVFHLAFFITAP